MKSLLISLIIALLIPSVCLAGTGSGPWSLGAYYPGQLDGRYQAAVYGNNINGVVGFALLNGAPPFDERTSVAAAAAGAGGGAAGAGGAAGGAQQVNTDLGLDETQNYFAIFVQGRTYTGRTVGMVDIDRKTVTATMIGAQPTFGYQELTIGQALAVPNGLGGFDIAETQTDVPILDNLPLINRGLSGGFKAKLKNTSSLPTFSGSGQLSTPAQNQTIIAQPNTFPIPNIDPTQPPIVVTGFTPATLAAQIVTDSVPFSVYGIKTSFFVNDPLASTNAQAAQ